MKIKVKSFFYWFTLFSIIGSVYWRWLLPGVISWGDWSYLTKSQILDFFPSVWRNIISLGDYQIITIHHFPILTLQWLFSRILHLDFGVIERIFWFYPFVFLSFLSPWYLAHTLGFRRPGATAAILIFSLNSFLFLLPSVMTIDMAVVLVPLVFALFIRIIQRPILFRGLVFSLVLTWQMIYELRIAYVTFIFCVLYLLYFLIFERKGNLWQLGKTLFLTVIGVSLLNAFWFIPFLFKNMEGMGSGILLPAAYISAAALRAQSYMTLLHSLGVHYIWWGESNIANPVHPHFLVLPIVAFSVLLFRLKDRKVLFFALSALIFSFLVKGTKPPLGGINIWLFLHLPGFSMFRCSGHWHSPLIISYAILVAYLVEEIVKRKFLNRAINWVKHRLSLPLPLIRIGLAIGIIGLFFLIFPVQPLSTHRFIAHPRQHPGHKEVHYEKIYIPCQVPQEYFFLEDFLHKQPHFFRTLWVPILYRFGYRSSQHPILQGMVLTERLLPFCNDNLKEYFARRISYISHPSILLPLRLFSIKYVIMPDAPQGALGEYYWFELPPKYYHKLLEKTSRFHPVPFPGKIRLYEVSDPLPHLYTSTTPALIVGNLEALIPLTYTTYLDDQPIFFFDEQQEGKSLKRLLPQVSTIVFYNSNPLDLALQLLEPDYGIRSDDGEKPVIFEAKEKGTYQIWKSEDALQASGLRPPALGVRVNGKEVIQATRYKIEDRGLKWKRIGGVELKEGTHRISVEKAPQEIIIIPEEKIIQAEKKVQNYLKKAKAPTYFFSKKLSSDIDSWERRSLRSSFYLPSSDNYSLRAKVSPRYVEALDYGLKEEAGKYGKKWSFVPKNVKYFTSTRKDILTVNTYFDGDAKEREFLKLERDVKPVDIERYPDFEINYSFTHPDIQRVEVILGVDLNNDGKVNARIFEELPPGLEKEFRRHSFNLYEKVNDSLDQKLPTNASFRLVKLYFKISKKDNLDCSTSPNKGWVKTSFKNFGLCGFSEDKYVKSRDYAFNKRIDLHKEFPPEADQPLAEKKGESKVVLSRSFKGLDLEKYPFLNLIHQNEDPESLLVSIILDFDFNHDGESDGKVTYEGVTAEHSFFDAYQLARTEFPDKDRYRLIKLEIKASRAYVFNSDDVSAEPSFSLFLQHLQIYNEEIIPYKEVLRAMPILKIDQRKLSLTKSGSWYTTSPVYLKEGYHNLEALFSGLETRLDFIIVEPRAESRERRAGGKVSPEGQAYGASKWESEKVGSGTGEQSRNRGPEIIFQKINPTKYKVKIKGAKKPFWLVFSENFHEGWRAYVEVQSPKSKVQSQEGNFQKIVAKYPRLGVEEASSLQKFTPGDVKYLFRKADIEEHYLVNSYANAWYIDPSKVHPPNWQRQLGGPKAKVKEMEIVLYFWPQGLFYVGLFISGLTLIGYLSYLFYNRRKRKKPGAFLKKASCRRKS